MVTVTQPSRSLKQRVFNASAWSIAGYAFNIGARFASSLVMTRLLLPSMFGVMAIASIVIVGMTLFSDLGLKQSIIQSKRGKDRVFLNTAWSVQIVRGLLLWILALCFCVLLVVADYIGIISAGTVYADPILPYVIAATSFGLVIGGFTSTKMSEASRNLQLSRVTAIDTVTQVAGLACMLIWAFFDRSVWALVAGTLFLTLTRTVLSHVCFPGAMNRWHWEREAVHEIFHFGKWILFSSILGFVTLNADRLILGGAVESSVLGVYSIAFTSYLVFQQLIRKIINDVSYPALSSIVRDRPDDLKKSAYRLHLIIASFAYVCAGMLIVSGNALIGFLYDPRYAEAGHMLQILAVGLIAVPFQISVQSFIALGRPELNTRILGIRLILVVTFMLVGIHFFGLTGGIWGLVLSHLLALAPLIAYSIKLKLFDVRRELMLLPVTVVGLAAGYALEAVIGLLRAKGL